jgi:hypothetical protein
MGIRQLLGCRFGITLTPQTECFDNRTVTLNIVAFNVIEQSATLTDQHQQSPTGVVIFFMHFQMLGQVGYPMGEKTDLDFRGPGIGVVFFVFFNEFLFGFRRIRQCFVLLKMVADYLFAFSLGFNRTAAPRPRVSMIM